MSVHSERKQIRSSLQKGELQNTIRITSNLIELLNEGLFPGRATGFVKEGADFLNAFRASAQNQLASVTAELKAAEEASNPKGAKNARKTPKAR